MITTANVSCALTFTIWAKLTRLTCSRFGGSVYAMLWHFRFAVDEIQPMPHFRNGNLINDLLLYSYDIWSFSNHSLIGNREHIR